MDLAGKWLMVMVVLLLRMTLVRLSRIKPHTILHSDSDDEDIIVGSGQGWASGSGFLDVDLYSEAGDDEDLPVTRSPLRSSAGSGSLRFATPELDLERARRISCIVCTTDGDASCRDPYVRNESHVKPCESTVEGCLKVLTPSGDTYRSCLYGMFGTAEQAPGCRSIREEQVGHRFMANVSATICVCRHNECNGADLNAPLPPTTSEPLDFMDAANTVSIRAHRISHGVAGARADAILTAGILLVMAGRYR
ncbi:uncharacterized protein LOC129590415 [Paramacrobiotus metropolitanus]|uniref:uncharacterized protein LOC129590415 n=1 Tax=Paramacrobiotus metropolitanus TaxID=2943436 RepID=UPI0024460995|nr:uncharacterized protein LOC129590415 [Paramacrobiotus metropolitanus]